MSGAEAANGLVSHGICESCRDNIFFQGGARMQEYIDSLKLPVAVINEQGFVQTINTAARRFLQKETVPVEGLPGGVVFECEYARHPEGCGNTLHCSACAIRRCVIYTFDTGEPQHQVPATLRYCGKPGVPEEIIMYISTEKVGEVVLLRIDWVGDAPDDAEHAV